MRSDIYGNPIFQEQDILKLLYQGNISSLTNVIVESSPEINKLIEHSGLAITQCKDINYNINIEEFDKSCQNKWFMPEDYCPNLVEMLYGMCSTQEQTDRVSEELTAFIEHGMMDLLFYLKYLVDTLRENKVIWGVGRGSSVSSYVLYLLGVHKIDSMKYNLDWREFLR